MSNQEHITTAKEYAKRYLQNFERGPESNQWYQNRRKILEHIINDDINNFINWEVIRNTMFVDKADYIKSEFNELRFAPDYVQWSKAMKETTIGCPPRAEFYPSSSGNLIHHAHHIYKFEYSAKKDITSFQNILEFGGGYGSMCRLIKQHGYMNNYVIFDLPEVILLQKFFLRSLGYVVWDTIGDFKKHGGIYCTSGMEELDSHYDLFIGTWSISDTSFEFRNKIFYRTIDNYLLSYQNEFGVLKNHDYFIPFMKDRPKNTWETWKIEHLYGEQFYLMGWK
jgi:hypothetical protein